MDFPKEFKDFKECEEYFTSKGAGIFHGEKEVAVRVLSNDSKHESKCVYTVNKDLSLTKDDSQTEPETKPTKTEGRGSKKEPEKKPEEPSNKKDETELKKNDKHQ